MGFSATIELVAAGESTVSAIPHIGSTVTFVSGISSLSKGLSTAIRPSVPDLELNDGTLGVLGQNGLG